VCHVSVWCLRLTVGVSRPLVGYTLTVIAAAVSSFYWTGGDPSKMPRMPVLWAMRRVARYHLGSIALGAFLVAVIQYIRVLLEYVDRKTKEMQEDNPVIKYAMCCIKSVPQNASSSAPWNSTPQTWRCAYDYGPRQTCAPRALFAST